MVAKLDALPAELRETIAFHVNKHDLLALRLTSRALEATTLKAFKEAFFTTRRIYIVERDLRLLLKILEDANFGSAIRNLEICIDEYDDEGHQYGLWESVKAFFNSKAWELKKARAAQRRMKQQNLDFDLLTEVFTNLKTKNIKLDSLILVDNGKSPTYEQAVGISRQPPSTQDQGPFEMIVYGALFNSRYDCIRNFSVQTTSWSCTLPQTEFDRPPHPSYFTPVIPFDTFPNLRTLHLTNLEPWSGEDLPVISFSGNLSQFPHLRHLTIAFRPNKFETFVNTHAAHAVLAGTFEELEVLSLGNVLLSWEQITWLWKEGRNETLRTLELEGVGIYGRREWEEEEEGWEVGEVGLEEAFVRAFEGKEVVMREVGEWTFG